MGTGGKQSTGRRPCRETCYRIDFASISRNPPPISGRPRRRGRLKMELERNLLSPIDGGGRRSLSGGCSRSRQGRERCRRDCSYGLDRRWLRGVSPSPSPESPARLTSCHPRSGTIAVYSLPASSALPQASASSSPPEAPLRPAFSHECGLRASLNTTASALVTGRVECLAWCGRSWVSLSLDTVR